MDIYNFNKETKEFISKTVATESPLEKGVFLIPANATITKPLDTKENFAVCFNEDKQEWEYIEDNRNKTVYNKETRQESKIDYLGVIKDDVTTLKPEQFDKWDYTTNSWVCDEVEKEKSRVQNINSYTQSYIYLKYPQPKQSSANLGVYDEAYKNEMISFISNCITLSNEAIDNGTSFEDYKAMLSE
jgi:hypothetical protein